LENPSFRDRAPAEVVAQEEVRLENKETELAKQRQHLDELG
jgi:valyl-tRNA synthetase